MPSASRRLCLYPQYLETRLAGSNLSVICSVVPNAVDTGFPVIDTGPSQGCSLIWSCRQGATQPDAPTSPPHLPLQPLAYHVNPQQ